MPPYITMIIYTRAYPKEFFAFGEYKVFSLHQKAINLINAQGNIVSLHPAIDYMTSFGYVLSGEDYDYLYDQLSPNIQAYISENKILLADRQIRIQGRAIDTRIRSIHLSEAISPLLGAQDFAQSGLMPINKMNATLLSMRTYLEHPTDENAEKMVKNIGLGQGLTPSFDDALVGMLAMIYLHNQGEKYIPRLRKWINYTALKASTTVISIKFLTEALEGVFSYPFYRLLKRLDQQHKLQNELSRFKHYGHSSGIDTLLGMNMTQQTFKEKTL